ncbi:hypothetical protein Tco_1362481 [Tanacetum coccineum]
MAALESCPKHNMIAYLEKTDGNAGFHEIMDFLTRSSIYYALTVSLVISTTFVKQLWMSAKSKTINNVRYITAIVVGKPVTISEASIRRDLLFDDADGIYTLNNQAIFDTIKLMGGKNFSGNVTPLFDSMLVQPIEDEGEALERPSESQPIPSPPYPSEDQPESQPDPSPRPYPLIRILDSNLEGSAKEIKDLKAQIKNLKRKAKHVISHHKAWMKSVSMKKRLARKKSLKKKSKDQVSTDKIGEDENATPTRTPTVFGDDETIVEFLVSMSQNKAKQKGVEIKDAEDSDKPRPTSTRSLLTLKPLPKIDPIDKGKKVLEEETEKVQEEWETKEEKKKLAEEEATKAALIRDYDDIQARIKADSILAARLQEEEREKFTIEERAKLLHDTIATQRRFLTQQRAAEIRSRPPKRTQLRNQMMTYLKHVGGKKHSDLKTKNFEEIQVLYEKVKRSDENFIAIGSAEDERLIKDVNKKATGTKKDDSIKKESKEEESTRKRKLGTRKKIGKKDSNKILLRMIKLIGDLMIMFNPDDEDEFWNSQQDWNVVSWKLHSSSGVHTLMTEAGLVIHMLVEKKYPLRKKVLLKLLILKLEFEEDSTMALELIRFVKKLIAELEPEDSDGNEEDL